ncbi:MAG: DsrE family protein [Saprospiraceae bacterium]|nr:DsrE family protein [Saprospiraceae bacterium]
MNILFILNDAPYGNERMYNAFRLAHQMRKDNPETGVWIFLMADAVTAALPNQETPKGYYNIARMLKLLVNDGAEIKLCGSCVQARGLGQITLAEGVEASNMQQLAAWTVESDKVLVF